MSGPSESGGGASEAGQILATGEDLGDAEALFQRAARFRDGEGVPRDFKEAARLLHLAAERSHAGSQYALGTCYRLGKGVLHRRAVCPSPQKTRHRIPRLRRTRARRLHLRASKAGWRAREAPPASARAAHAPAAPPPRRGAAGN
ncbi:hypothetical protein T492DRAFT_1013428 [Pavlovales sp. CCMP2436]|nr:hypothetical protein T492DRAFT_1013428 [Pavlovales sp. CCMP2436]